MGMTQIKGHENGRNQFVNFTSLNWELRPNTTKRTEYGQFNTYRNRYTHEEIDRYDLLFPTQHEEENYYQCLMERLREDYIVNTVYYEKNDGSQFCGRVHRGQAYIQHIPVRLCDVTDIPFPENIYMLRLALLGFEKLYQKVGYFEVKEDLVCIDKEGTVRVWMNSDLSKNYPEGIEKDGQGSKDGQRLMVGEIVGMIDRNTEEIQNQDMNISLYFQKNGIKYPTFVEAINLIDSFVQEHSIKLPTYCHSIIQIFREDYGAEFNVLEEEEMMGGDGIMLGAQSNPSRENVLQPGIHVQEQQYAENEEMGHLERIQQRPNNQYQSCYNEPLQAQQSQRSNQSGSRGFMLSQIKENTSRENFPLYPPQNEAVLFRQPPQQVSTPYERAVSPPRVTFSYQTNHTNYNYINPPLVSYYPPNNQPMYQYEAQKIEQRSERSSIGERYPSKAPRMDYQGNTELDDEDIQIDPEIYADMLKYL